MPKHKNGCDHKVMMTNADLWPAWPFLPIKRGYILEDNNTGVLWVRTACLTVHLVNLFMIPKKLEEFKALPKIEYASVDALLADGWVVD